MLVHHETILQLFMHLEAFLFVHKQENHADHLLPWLKMTLKFKKGTEISVSSFYIDLINFIAQIICAQFRKTRKYSLK